MRSSYDVVVIGSGPNGLAAANVAARRGMSTIVLEAHDTVGGGLRSAELTVPGFLHDTCSSVHPMGIASPYFRELSLDQHGLEWIIPKAAAAHPLDGGDAVILHNDVHQTVTDLGRDQRAYERSIGVVARNWSKLEPDILGPIGFPSHPIAYVRFGLPALVPAQLYARSVFSTTRARALFAGVAAHSILPFTKPGGTAVALALTGVGHARGWPVPRGGAQSIARALAARLRSHGGEIETGVNVERYEQLPKSNVVLFDTSPRSMARIMGDRLPSGFAQSMERYRYGPGAFKVDWALSAPIPWQAPACLEASTVHVGGTLEEIAAAEAAPWRGACAERPFVLVTQASLFDDSRAPASKHTAWGYCHVPNGSTVDMTARIESQIERFAPGFKDVILARSISPPSAIERENPNLVGGDVGGGSNELLNLFFRPTWRRYATPVRGIYLCSAATPPGAGVHGMCGYHAAMAALAGG